jgi:pSer/pThr/pTyr-binding forkhead associated (FHA) protein
MAEMREVYDDPGHALRGPHQDMPESFSPLRLRTEPGEMPIVVVRHIAIVGRHSGADVRLAHPEVSRRHCRLVFEQGVWRVYDLNSLNGVFINDARLAAAPLYTGDRLRIGPVILRIESATQQVLRQIADRMPPEAA